MASEPIENADLLLLAAMKDVRARQVYHHIAGMNRLRAHRTHFFFLLDVFLRSDVCNRRRHPKHLRAQVTCSGPTLRVAVNVFEVWRRPRRHITFFGPRFGIRCT